MDKKLLLFFNKQVLSIISFSSEASFFFLRTVYPKAPPKGIARTNTKS
ncbi:hypothetical protein [Clostridium butyricum]|nr:hypothetical protein [Clostridium butyricum]